MEFDKVKSRSTNNQRFWMVIKGDGASCSKRHDTRLQAVKEAERLSIQHIGLKFFVLETVGVVRCEMPSPMWAEV